MSIHISDNPKKSIIDAKLRCIYRACPTVAVSAQGGKEAAHCSSKLPPLFLAAGAAVLLRDKRPLSLATTGITAVIRRGPFVPRMLVS
jgi:hypothetical protein